MDRRWFTNVARLFQRVLLGGHEAVVFSDADEYLIPTDGTLRAFSERFLVSPMQHARATGWGVVHQVDCEQPAEPGDVLAGRGQAWRMPGYDKTLISKIPLAWSKGSHDVYRDGRKASDDPPDPGLELVHLRDVDVAVFAEQARNRLRANPDAASSHGSADPEAIVEYLRTRVAPWNPQAREYVGIARPVPDRWRWALRSQT